MKRLAVLVLLVSCGGDDGGGPSTVDALEADAPVCGDGAVNGAEACDDGNTDDTDGCIACAFATCGDGFVRRGVETCDDGTAGCVRCTTCTGVADPAVRSRIESISVEPIARGTDEFATYLRGQRELFQGIIRSANIRLD